VHACSHAHTAASAALLLRMTSAPSSARRSTRTSQQPLSLAEEQAESIGSAVQLHTLSTALLLSSTIRGNRRLANLDLFAEFSGLGAKQHHEHRSAGDAAYTLVRDHDVL